MIIFLFSCQSDLKKEEPTLIEGDNNSNELLSPHFIYFEKEKIIEYWKDSTSIVSSSKIDNFLAFEKYGEIEMDSFDNEFIYYTKDSTVCKQIFNFSEKLFLEKPKILFFPSKLNDFGHFSPCMDCPEEIKIEHLKARLDYEDFFGKNR